MVAPNPLPIISLLLGEVSVLLPVMCSWEGYSVTPLYPRWWCILWRWPMEFYVPTRSEIGLVAWSHFWWLSSPSGFFVARQCGVPGGPWGVGFLVAYWCDGFWPSSSADSFSVHSVAFIVYVFSDVLFKMAPKVHILLQGGGRHQARSSDRQRRGQPGMYKDLKVISISLYFGL